MEEIRSVVYFSYLLWSGETFPEKGEKKYLTKDSIFRNPRRKRSDFTKPLLKEEKDRAKKTFEKINKPEIDQLDVILTPTHISYLDYFVN